MRELTEEEQRIMDLIPQELFTKYAGSRLAEAREPRTVRSCGHAPPNPTCEICQRAELLFIRQGNRLAREFGQEPEELKARLKKLRQEFVRFGNGDLDFPGYVLSVLKTNRRKAVELIRAFGVAK